MSIEMGFCGSCCYYPCGVFCLYYIFPANLQEKVLKKYHVIVIHFENSTSHIPLLQEENWREKVLICMKNIGQKQMFWIYAKITLVLLTCTLSTTKFIGIMVYCIIQNKILALFQFLCCTNHMMIHWSTCRFHIDIHCAKLLEQNIFVYHYHKHNKCRSQQQTL